MSKVLAAFLGVLCFAAPSYAWKCCIVHGGDPPKTFASPQDCQKAGYVVTLADTCGPALPAGPKPDQFRGCANKHTEKVKKAVNEYMAAHPFGTRAEHCSYTCLFVRRCRSQTAAMPDAARQISYFVESVRQSAIHMEHPGWARGIALGKKARNDAACLATCAKEFQ